METNPVYTVSPWAKMREVPFKLFDDWFVNRQGRVVRQLSMAELHDILESEPERCRIETVYIPHHTQLIIMHYAREE